MAHTMTVESRKDFQRVTCSCGHRGIWTNGGERSLTHSAAVHLADVARDYIGERATIASASAHYADARVALGFEDAAR